MNNNPKNDILISENIRQKILAILEYLHCLLFNDIHLFAKNLLKLIHPKNTFLISPNIILFIMLFSLNIMNTQNIINIKNIIIGGKSIDIFF